MSWLQRFEAEALRAVHHHRNYDHTNPEGPAMHPIDAILADIHAAEGHISDATKAALHKNLTLTAMARHVADVTAVLEPIAATILGLPPSEQVFIMDAVRGLAAGLDRIAATGQPAAPLAPLAPLPAPEPQPAA